MIKHQKWNGLISYCVTLPYHRAVKEQEEEEEEEEEVEEDEEDDDLEGEVEGGSSARKRWSFIAVLYRALSISRDSRGNNLKIKISVHIVGYRVRLIGYFRHFVS
jgi:hypothetical protein